MQQWAIQSPVRRFLLLCRHCNYASLIQVILQRVENSGMVGRSVTRQRGKMCVCVCACVVCACVFVCVSPLMLIMDIGIQPNCAMLIQVIPLASYLRA